MNGLAHRPAESLSFAAALVVVVVAVFGITDPQVYQALIVIVGALPAAVTGLVAYIRGQRAPNG